MSNEIRSEGVGRPPVDSSEKNPGYCPGSKESGDATASFIKVGLSYKLKDFDSLEQLQKEAIKSLKLSGVQESTIEFVVGPQYNDFPLVQKESIGARGFKEV